MGVFQHPVGVRHHLLIENSEKKRKTGPRKKNRTKKGIPGLTRRTRRKKTISGKDFFFSKRFLFVVFRFDWYLKHANCIHYTVYILCQCIFIILGPPFGFNSCMHLQPNNLTYTLLTHPTHPPETNVKHFPEVMVNMLGHFLLSLFPGILV